MNGPSENLTWGELACHDRIGTPYPLDWRTTRARDLSVLFEHVRYVMGDQPLCVLSAYRTGKHNKAVGGAPLSQHVQGRALDISRGDESADAFARRAMLAIIGAGAGLIGGLGIYPWGIHIDVRPKDSMRVAVWEANNFESRG